MFTSTINKSKLIQTAKALINTNTSFQKAEVYLHLTLFSFPEHPSQMDSFHLITIYSLLSFINYKRTSQSISTSLWLISKLKHLSIFHIKDNSILISYIKALIWSSIVIKPKYPLESLYYISYAQNIIKTHNIILSNDYLKSIDTIYKESLLINDKYIQRYLQLHEQYDAMKHVVKSIHNNDKEKDGWIISKQWVKTIETYVHNKQYKEENIDNMFNENNVFLINNELLLKKVNLYNDNEIIVDINEISNSVIISNDIYMQIQNTFGVIFPLSVIHYKQNIKTIPLLILNTSLLNTHPHKCILRFITLNETDTYYNIYLSLLPDLQSILSLENISHTFYTCNYNNELLYTLLFLYYHNIEGVFNLNEIEPILYEKREYPSSCNKVVILYLSSSVKFFNNKYNLNKCVQCGKNLNDCVYKCNTFAFLQYINLTYCSKHCKMKDVSHKQLHYSMRKYVFKNNNFDYNNKLIKRVISLNSNINGIINTGNTCYMNSILQCLSHTPHFISYFLFKKYIIEKNEIHSNKTQITDHLYNLFTSLWFSNNNQPISPLEFIFTFNSLCSNFSLNEQHDASEFLTYLLDLLHECLNRIEYQPYIELNDNIASSYIQYSNIIKMRDNSIITDLFQGVFQNTITCNYCKTTRYIYEQFTMLSLPIVSTNHNVMFYIYNSKTHLLDQHNIKINSYDKINEMLLINEIHTIYNTFHNNYDIVLLNNNNTIHSILTPYTHDIHLNDIISTNPHLKIILYERIDNYNNIYISFISTSIYHKFIYVPYNKIDVHSFPFPISVYNNMTIRNLYNIIINEIHDSNISLYMWNYNNKFICDFCGRINCDMCNVFDLFEIEDKVEWVMNKVDKNDVIVMGCEITNERGIKLNKEKDVDNKKGMPYRNVEEKVELKDCIEEFLKEEILDGENMWYCSKCKAKRSAVKKMSICKTPIYLIIQFKRFANEYNNSEIYNINNNSPLIEMQQFLNNSNNTFSNKKRKKNKKKNNIPTYNPNILQHQISLPSYKNNTSIYFPTTNLDIAPYIIEQSSSSLQEHNYNLYGIVEHFGTISNGHYISINHHFPSNKWYQYDDSCVSPIIITSPYSSCNAYLLFYKLNI